MRAIRVHGHTATLDVSARDPRPAPGEAVIRPVMVGLSGLDTPGAEAIIGRECVGVVESFHESVPEADRARWAGRRVVLSPEIACGRCDLCRAGLGAHCRERVTLGVGGAGGRDGCLAERVTVPTTSLHAVPDHVTNDQAVLAVPVAGAVHAARVGRAEPSAFVTVLGDTLPAILTAQILRKTYSSLRLLGADPSRLAVCDRLALRHRPLNEAGQRRDQALVIECTGTAEGLAAALRLLRPRGRLVLTAPVSGDLAAAVRDEIEITGASAAPVHEGLATLSRGDIDTTGLITRRFRLETGVRAVQAVATELKVVVELA